MFCYWKYGGKCSIHVIIIPTLVTIIQYSLHTLHEFKQQSHLSLDNKSENEKYQESQNMIPILSAYL